MSGLPGFIVGWPFRERVAEVRDTRLLTSYGRHVVLRGSDELHEGALAPVVGLLLLAHDPRKGQAAGRGALVVEFFVGALREVAARFPPDQDTLLSFLDALEMSNASSNPASNARREVNPVRGYMEHGHEHLVVLIGSLGLLPSACPLDRFPREVLVALAAWHLEPSDAELGSGQAFCEGN